MSENNGPYDFFDPTGVMKKMRDSGVDAYAKMMTEFVNTEAYAEAQGAMLDAWLSNSAPFRKAMESAMSQSMAALNLPSRDDITRLAERLTNIEMRLDDMDANLDEAVRQSSNSSAKKSKAGKGEK